MPLSKTELEMTQIVVDRFLKLKTTTARKDLVTKFKSVDAVDRLTNLSILNRVNQAGDLLPRPLAFEYYNNSETLKNAKTSLTVVLRVLQNLYDLTPPKKQVTVPEILNHTRKMYEAMSAETVNLGLYLAKEFPALESYGSTGGQPSSNIIPGFEWVVIHERIVTINPETEWDERMAQLKTAVEGNMQPPIPKPAVPVEPESKRSGAETERHDTGELSTRILEVLDQTYPDTLPSEEALRSRLPEYVQTTSEEWFRALDALQKEGWIDGKFLRGSENRIEAAALLAITPAGRQRVRENRTTPATSVNVGDQIGSGSESSGYPETRSVVPDDATRARTNNQEPANVTGDSRGGVAPGTGPSTHVARDRWTIEDSLGHFPYAYAIYRFLTDGETKPPLAISIQAPWGGGKSSLMRMIQSQLDPEYANGEKVEQWDSAKATVGDVVREIEPAIGKVKEPRGASVKEPSKTDATAGDNDHARRFRLPDLKEGGERRVTIWFNAWKYESTAQVWAGLADCIIKQIGERLGPVERELFWFHLQLRRVDIGKVRRRIYEEVVALFEDQIRNCRRSAAAKGWVVLDEYIRFDSELTGRTVVGRHGILELLEFAEPRPLPFDYVLIDDTSRHARNVADYIKELDLFIFYGVSVYFVSDNLDSRDGENFRLVHLIKSYGDERYSKDLGKKIHRGQEGQILRGYTAGGTCYGYRNKYLRIRTRRASTGKPKSSL